MFATPCQLPPGGFFSGLLGECGYDEDDIADHEGVKIARAALSKARGEA